MMHKKKKKRCWWIAWSFASVLIISHDLLLWFTRFKMFWKLDKILDDFHFWEKKSNSQFPHRGKGITTAWWIQKSMCPSTSSCASRKPIVTQCQSYWHTMEKLLPHHGGIKSIDYGFCIPNSNANLNQLREQVICWSRRSSSIYMI